MAQDGPTLTPTLPSVNEVSYRDIYSIRSK